MPSPTPVPASLAALEATILARLAAAESAREAAVAERDEAYATAEMASRTETRQQVRAMNAEAARDAALARAERAEKALEASAYLTSRYRDCWLGKTVRDLPEAEAAYVSANAAVVAAALAHPATAEDA